MKFDVLKSAITFKTSRSSGSGGQHVNKVSTKVDLSFDLWASDGFDQDEKQIIQMKLKNRISQNGILHVVCQSTRSQTKNKEKAIEKLLHLLEEALVVPKKRKKKKPSKREKELRLERKKRNSQKKAARKKVSVSKDTDLSPLTN